MNNKDHFLTLDGFRGIAALLVVLRHTLPYFDGNPFFSSYLAVDLFFLLSGAVLARSYEAKLLTGMTLREFLKVRLLRLYPLYFLGMILGIIASLTDSLPYKGHTAISAVFGMMLLPALYTTVLFPLNGPAWSLSAELMVNVAYALKIKKLSDRVLLTVMGVSLLCLIAFSLYWPAHNFDAGFYRKTYYVSFLRVGFSFAAGVLLYRLFLRKGIPTKVDNSKALLCIVAVTLILAASPAKSLLPLYDALAIALAFPILVYAGMRYQVSGFLATACKFFGAISYPIYIVHLPVAEFVRQQYEVITGQEIRVHAPVAGFVFVAALIVFAWLLNKFYDEPVRRAVGAWLSGRKPAAGTPPPIQSA